MRHSWSLMALCLTAICIGIPLSANGVLLFHLAPVPAILFSALFFGGVGCGTLLGGRVADRFPAAHALLASCTGMTFASIALPLWPQSGWLLLCRGVLGVWVGSVFVSGARLASVQSRALLVQGLYGGFLQLGVGLGVVLTPVLLSWAQAQGALLCWALGSLVPVVVWGVQASQGGHPRAQPPHAATPLSAVLGTPALWKLGAIHLGTFGMGTALAGWITLYLSQRYHLPVVSAAAFGSLYLLAGIILRPAGGLVLQWSQRWMMGLIQAAVALVVLGVLLLSVAPTLPLALGATALLALGMNSPYAAVLTLAARYGRRTGVGAASAQGTVILLLCLGLITLPLFIGAGMRGGQPFAICGLLCGAVALLAAIKLKPEPLDLNDGTLNAVKRIDHQDERSNYRPALMPQREPFPCDGTAVERGDGRQEGVLHHG